MVKLKAQSLSVLPGCSIILAHKDATLVHKTILMVQRDGRESLHAVLSLVNAMILASQSMVKRLYLEVKDGSHSDFEIENLGLAILRFMMDHRFQNPNLEEITILCGEASKFRVVQELLTQSEALTL